MKTLVLIRHSKSDWTNKELTDKQRPLNKRGKRDAPFMAKLLYQRQDIHPTLFITSPAERSIQTAKEFAKIFNYDFSKSLINDEVYSSGVQDIVKLISEIDNKHTCVLLFGHNPEITHLANQLSDSFIENIPTTGVLCIDFDFDDWKDILTKRGKTRFFEYPKKYFKKN